MTSALICDFRLHLMVMVALHWHTYANYQFYDQYIMIWNSPHLTADVIQVSRRKM